LTYNYVKRSDVLGVFLVCWAPFFTINIINAVCIRQASCDSAVTTLLGDDDDAAVRTSIAAGEEVAAAATACSDVCHVDPAVVSSFVWLGYINSALNPIIYTIFNVEFRRAFDRLLRRPCRALAETFGGREPAVTLRGMAMMTTAAAAAAAASAVTASTKC